ncbi:MAG: hypothetical protein ACD_21C00132G0008 [uncultured bacterium]|nr:MAG: hypothetical protein ACD_21C00132G0008 [uncultured bacterium]
MAKKEKPLMPINKFYTKAFSLIELLVAIALVAIILLVAIPSFGGMVGKNNTMAYANELMTALQFTRSVAIKLGESVAFCGSRDHKICDGLWQNGSVVVASSGEVLRVLPPAPNGVKLIWRGSFGIKNVVTFSPAGFPSGQQGSFYCCHRDSSENALAVILSLTGRVRVSNKTADGEIIPCNL